MRRILSLLVLFGCVVPTTSADKVVLKSGKTYEGEIIKEDDKYVHIQTALGRKVVRQTSVRSIERDDEAEDESERKTASFVELTPVQRQIRNARAEYRLGRYDAIVKRIEPLLHKDDADPDQMELRWLLVDAYERLARFSDAEALLERIKKIGRKPDKMRAQAHLDIFSRNDGYRLEHVNDRRAREFLDREQFLKGKKKNALADRELMEAALIEYVEQILRSEETGLKALRRSLHVDETVEAIEEMPNAGRLEKYLPYYSTLTKVEKSIAKAKGILPTYTRGYELDLVRTEAQHLSDVIDVVFRSLLETYPESFGYAFDPQNGKLTKQGREQWRENCQKFLDESKPLELMGEYLLKKLERYPRELRRLQRTAKDSLNLLKQLREAIKRKKDSRIYV